MEYQVKFNGIWVKESCFSLEDTLDCGQTFRFYQQADGSYFGIAKHYPLTICKEGDGVLFCGVSEATFLNFWRGYFDLDTDYAKIQQQFSKDPVLREACAYASGIRILRQDPFEMLCSAILSANNNIGRIKRIVMELCAQFGEPLGEGMYTFPEPAVLACCKEEDLAGIKAGYRAKYLLDAAQKVTSGLLQLDSLHSLELSQAREQLQTVQGVGPKVADCILLFGFHRVRAFPVDVWVKRALASFYPDGLCEEASPFEGIAQQYLFHYVRTNRLLEPAKAAK